MATRSRLPLGLLATSLLLPALAGLAAGAHGGVHVPEARVGDEAVYAPPGSREGSFSFAWEPKAPTEDRWGIGTVASVLRTVLPRSDLDREAAEGEWAELREAFADSGTLLWRSDQTNQSRGGDVLHGDDAVSSLVNADVRTSAFLDRTTYDPTPSVRSCFAHHGLQGQRIAPGQVVDLETLCPALATEGLTSEALPALATTFLGRAAVELRYEVLHLIPYEFDVSLPMPGMLRVVLADGIPFLVEVEASGTVPGGEWHQVLASVREGAGPAVPPWRRADSAGAGEVRPGARFAPLTEAGPADGGSGLPYRLEEAVASVRADVTLVAFQEWLRGHPGAFVVRAVYKPWESEDAALANWILYFGGPRADGWVDVYTLDAYRGHASPLPSVAGSSAPVSYNMDGVSKPPVVADPPGGEPSLDLASALRAWPFPQAASVDPRAFRSVTFDAPASGAPARWTVERWGPGTAPNAESVGAILTLDASNGAALELLTTARRLTVSNVEVGEGTLQLLAQEAPGPEGLPLAVATVAGVATAAFVALLAHGGYLAAGYSRLRQSDLLDHPSRLAMRNLIREYPGIHLKGVAAAMGGGLAVTRYHLRVLERGGIVEPEVLPGYKRYYLTGTVPPAGRRALAELEGGSARTLYEIIRSEPGITLTELARRTHLSLPAAHKTVERLRNAGLLEKRNEGRNVRILPRWTDAP